MKRSEAGAPMTGMDDIKAEFGRLSSLGPEADAVEKRRRGFAFERLLNGLFALEGLDPRTGYRPEGEQIDGSVYLDGRVFLIEAKWHVDPLPASTLYQFKGKVDGKLAGTIGIFISMSGYADHTVDALVLGKALNIVLFDGRDIDAAIVRGYGFKAVLKLKLRKAAEEGAIYFPAEGELVTAQRSQIVEIDDASFERTPVGERKPSSAENSVADLLIVCEGETDGAAIAVLAERLLRDAGSDRSIKIVVAMGKVTIPSVANAVRDAVLPETKVLIVVDGDNDPTGTEKMLAKGLRFDGWVYSIPDPSIEVWLDLDPRMQRRRATTFRVEQARRAAEALDISELRSRNAQFAKFCDAILGV